MNALVLNEGIDAIRRALEILDKSLAANTGSPATYSALVISLGTLRGELAGALIVIRAALAAHIDPQLASAKGRAA